MASRIQAVEKWLDQDRSQIVFGTNQEGFRFVRLHEF
jgi:hypothetical protein